MSGNGGAWGAVLWKDGYGGSEPQAQGISLEGGDPIVPFLPSTVVGSLLLPPAGLGVPAVRSGDVAFAQRDGVVQFADYYEPRLLTFQVIVKNDACPGCSSSPQIDGALVLNGVAPGRATAPDDASLDIVGDLDVSGHLAATDWTPAARSTIVSKWGAAPQRSHLFTIEPAGQLRLFWSPDGSTTLSATSTAVPVVANGADLWVRATIDVDNGAAGRTVTFYTSPDGVSWVQLGATVITAGVTAIFASTSPLEVGSHTGGTADLLAGRVFSVLVRAGIGGTIVADPDFVQPDRYSSFQDDSGNVWTVVQPAFLQPFVPAAMTARQKVARLTQEWSRNCSGATLLLFTDCHNPDATEEEKVYNGPYLVHGRPRVADVAWERSNRGAARVTLRFDAADAQLLLADTPDGSPWSAQHTTDADANANLAPDPDLSGLTMTLNGATVTDQHFTGGGPSGPDGGPYFSRFIIAANTSSPMTMALGPSGLAAIPVNPADVLSVAFWARKTPGGPSPRVDWTWYNAAGAVISNNTGAAGAATAVWQRFTQNAIVAPALAEFVQVRLSWSGTALINQTLDIAQAWVNMGAVATGPGQIEIVGTLCVYLEIELFGDLTAPIVVNYGGHEFTYGANIIGDVITIDTRYGRASDGFNDVTQNLSGDYSSPLEPGVHDVQMSSANPADTGSIRAEWANAVVSG